MKQGYVPEPYRIEKAKIRNKNNKNFLIVFFCILAIATASIIVLYGQKEPTEADLMLAASKARMKELELYNEERNQMLADAREQAQAGLQELEAVDGLVAELQTLVDSNGNIYYGNKDRVEEIIEQLNNLIGTTFSITNLP